MILRRSNRSRTVPQRPQTGECRCVREGAIADAFVEQVAIEDLQLAARGGDVLEQRSLAQVASEGEEDGPGHALFRLGSGAARP